MEGKDRGSQIRLINQALNAAVSSVNLARQLLEELEGRASGDANKTNNPPANAGEAASTKDLPGLIGTFDGQNLVDSKGQTFSVPENYASKSMIVYGDKLKMVEVNGEARFKQIERVKRQRAVGLLVKKEGRFTVVTSDGSYRVSPAAIAHFNGREGDEVHVVLPLSNKHVPFAAVESVTPKVSVGGEALPEEKKVKEILPEVAVKKVVKAKKRDPEKRKSEEVGVAPKTAEPKAETGAEKKTVESGPLIGDDELR